MRVGFAKTDITVFDPGMTMLGWAQIDNRATGVHTTLSAREVTIETDNARWVKVVDEQ